MKKCPSDHLRDGLVGELSFPGVWESQNGWEGASRLGCVYLEEVHMQGLERGLRGHDRCAKLYLCINIEQDLTPKIAVFLFLLLFTLLAYV
jgi:hypothetical protein